MAIFVNLKYQLSLYRCISIELSIELFIQLQKKGTNVLLGKTFWGIQTSILPIIDKF